MRRHRRERRLRSGPGDGLARRPGHRGLRRADLLFGRVLLARLRRRLVPVVVLHGRMGLRAAARGRDAYRSPVRLQALPSVRLAGPSEDRRAGLRGAAYGARGRLARRTAGSRLAGPTTRGGAPVTGLYGATPRR